MLQTPEKKSKPHCLDHLPAKVLSRYAVLPNASIYCRPPLKRTFVSEQAPEGSVRHDPLKKGICYILCQDEHEVQAAQSGEKLEYMPKFDKSSICNKRIW